MSRLQVHTGCVPAAECLRYQRRLNKEQRLLPSEPGGQSRGFVLNDSFAGRMGVGVGGWVGVAAAAAAVVGGRCIRRIRIMLE